MVELIAIIEPPKHWWNYIGRAVIVIVLWGGAAWVLAAGTAKVRRWWLVRRTESWPLVEAHVENANWDYQEGEGGSWPKAEVAYSYVVEGERYANIWKRDFTTADQATTFVMETRDRKLLVRYQPGKPEESVVWEVV